MAMPIGFQFFMAKISHLENFVCSIIIVTRHDYRIPSIRLTRDQEVPQLVS